MGTMVSFFETIILQKEATENDQERADYESSDASEGPQAGRE